MRLIFIVTVSLLLVGCGIIGGEHLTEGSTTNELFGGGNKADEMTIEQNISPMMMLLMIAGWVLPTPQQMIGSVGDFILRLFGRK